MIELLSTLGSILLCIAIYPGVASVVSKYVNSYAGVMISSLLISVIFIKLVFGFLIDNLISRIPAEYHSHKLNKYFGLIPGAINGFIYALIITACLLLLPVGQNIQKTAQHSLLAQQLSNHLYQLQVSMAPVLDDLKKGMITVTPGSGKFIKLDFQVDDAKIRSDLEADMLALINKERLSHNLNPLRADPELRGVARKHSADMFKRGYFSHFTPEQKDPFDRIKAAKVQFLAAGENLALAQTLALAHKGLMDSPGHRANILHRSFGRVGIGILDGGIYGLMITQNFRN